MPNWADVTLTTKGLKALDIFTTDGELDFNKIIPMPEELNITSGSLTGVALAIYNYTNSDKSTKAISEFQCCIYPNVLDKYTDKPINEKIEAFITYKRKKWLDAEINAKVRVESATDEEKSGHSYRYDLTTIKNHAQFPTIDDYGKRIAENIQKYGAPTWYEWSCKNWGTKWNASDTNIKTLDDGQDEVFFMTPWEAPFPIIRKISEMLGDVPLKLHRFADGDRSILDETYINGQEVMSEVREPIDCLETDNEWIEIFSYAKYLNGANEPAETAVYLDDPYNDCFRLSLEEWDQISLISSSAVRHFTILERYQWMKNVNTSQTLEL